MAYRNITTSLALLDDGELFSLKEHLKLTPYLDIMTLLCFKMISKCVNVSAIKFVGNV
ncbi:TPA: hypothetical protein OYC80_001649 [Staphylococcus aureus]|nr:hypothetical protein [Staphylococcus aureus]